MVCATAARAGGWTWGTEADCAAMPAAAGWRGDGGSRDAGVPALAGEAAGAVDAAAAAAAAAAAVAAAQDQARSVSERPCSSDPPTSRPSNEGREDWRKWPWGDDARSGSGDSRNGRVAGESAGELPLLSGEDVVDTGDSLLLESGEEPGELAALLTLLASPPVITPVSIKRGDTDPDAEVDPDPEAEVDPGLGLGSGGRRREAPRDALAGESVESPSHRSLEASLSSGERGAVAAAEVLGGMGGCTVATLNP
jgi:hypothetical protein